MKKHSIHAGMKTGLALFALIGCLAMTGCGADNTQTEDSTAAEDTADATETLHLSEIPVEDYVTLGEYKNIEVTATLSEVTDEDVESYIQYVLSYNPNTQEVTDRDTVENGDIVNIDYEGKKDDVAFDGGTAQGYDLTIGSGTFIDGFEEGLIGVTVGDTVDLNLTFPESYSNEELAGADVVFTVTVNSISADAGLTDDYVVSQGIDGVSTAEEYRQYVRNNLEEEAMEDYKYDVEMEVLEQVLANSTVEDAPQEFQQKYIDLTTAQMQYRASYYGMELEDFITAYFGIDLDTYNEEVADGAAQTAKQAMVCAMIAKTEGLEVTDDELDQAVETNYADYGYDSADDYRANIDTEEYRDSLLIEKVLDFLMDNAVITEE